MNWKLWLEGLSAAVVGGAVTTLTSGTSVTPENYKAIGTAAAINGAICGLLYIARSPKDRRRGAEERRKP